MKVVDRVRSVKVGVADENEYVREEPHILTRKRVLPPGTFYMSNAHRSFSHGHVLGSNPVITGKTKTSAMRGGGFMSRYVWPMKLVSRAKEGTSAIRGGYLFSSMFGLATVIRTPWSTR
jgi:hypothetical protein